jgi:hypothetical protein
VPLEGDATDDRVRRLLPPVPTDPFRLGRHLLEQHRWDPVEVERLDADDLRQHHANEHAWSRRLDHVHEGDPTR